jgi:hypothetical protein
VRSAAFVTLFALNAVGLLGALGGCTTPGYQRVRPTTINYASTEVPESQLLDVGVATTEVVPLSEKALVKQGTTPDIRRSESHFIPYHLKNTLQMSSHWGTVQVVPPEDDNVDLKVTSTLNKSNGEVIQLEVEAVDASGRSWLRRKYEAKAKAGHYVNTVAGEREVYQDLYNTVANDLAKFKRSLTPEQVEEIRTVSKLKFAGAFAPDAYGDYLSEGRNGRVVVDRLPADDDPLMERIDRIHAREQMFIDTLNQYYEGFYLQMWEAYENWRRYYLVEQDAKREAQSEAFWRTVGGALMIAAAVALQVGDVPNTGAVSGILILAGGQVVISGINVSQQVEIHAAAVQELAESFGSDIRPTVVELEGKQYELTGTAEEQYGEWRELLRQIYEEETGFAADGDDGLPGSVPASGATPAQSQP